MPALANVTVKKSDGTTDITYTGLTPSSGDKTPAVFRVQSVGTSVRERPEVRVSTYDSPDGNRRVVKENYVYPVVKEINGVNTVVDYITKSVETKYPKQAIDDDVKEAAYQSANVAAGTLFKSVHETGFAPT
jgi:hypothetical protein